MAKNENIDGIWKEFVETRDSYYRNIIMDHYLPLIKNTADRVHSLLPEEVELDDIISAGVNGCCECI